MTNVVKNNDKEKYMYSVYRIDIDGKSSFSFDNDSARNVIIFDVDNNSSSHTDNQKNVFLVLGTNGNLG